jgi:hypothetical protein
MNQIDKYIARATAGLPTRERIDTAAELRVHLNTQVKKHMLEGHTTEEAEFLAVDAMGEVAKVNRQFLGHIFTPRVGWGVLIASIIGLAGWFGGKTFLDNQTYAREVSIGIQDLLPSLGSYWNFEYRVPQGAKSFHLALNTPEFGQNIMFQTTLNHTQNYPSGVTNLWALGDTRVVKILIWRPKQEYSKCETQKNGFYYRITLQGSGQELYQSLPCSLNGKKISFSKSWEPTLSRPQINKWQILLDLSPHDYINGTFPDRTFKANQHVVFQDYSSSSELTYSSKNINSVLNPPKFLEYESDKYFKSLRYNNIKDLLRQKSIINKSK